MAHTDYKDTEGFCPACEFGPFTRNHYFTGKLLVERDFSDETRFHMEKLRHHQQRLHGWGVVCGLKVKAHPNLDCRNRFICIEPGTAIDCCGHEIMVCEPECIDIQTWPALKALADKQDKDPHTLQICIRYRECPTEEIPVLYDECGCDDTRCAPNRILESYEVDIILDPKSEELPPHSCEEILRRHLDGCPHCDTPNCVVLATIEKYHVGDKIEDQTDSALTYIDNSKGRHVLASTQVLQERIERLLQQGSGGIGLQDPPGSQGPKSDKGDPGIDTDLTHICAINWVHGSTTSLSELNTNGLLIAFNQPVRNGDIHRHSFIVLAMHKDEQSRTECWCELPGERIGGVQFTDNCNITNFNLISGSDTLANGAQFLPVQSFEPNQEYRVVLKGDFIRDQQGKGVDANHLPPWLPARLTGDGVAGGTFESWFST